MSLFSWFLPDPFGLLTDWNFICPIFLSGVQTIIKWARESKETMKLSLTDVIFRLQTVQPRKDTQLSSEIILCGNFCSVTRRQMCWCLLHLSHWSRGCNQGFHTLSVFWLVTAVVQQGFVHQLISISDFSPCFLVNDTEDSEGLPSLDKPGWYSQGNWPHLHELLKTMTGKPEPKVNQSVEFAKKTRPDRWLNITLKLTWIFGRGWIASRL